VRRFRDDLLGSGVNATIRVTRGADIDAACGQLAAAVDAGGRATNQQLRLARNAAAR